MPDTRTINRIARRVARGKELVDASLEVFITKGVDATSVDDIVRAAGVAKGTFYLYFATKNDAVNAVAERMVEGVTTRIETLANDRERSPVERLVAFATGVREVGGRRHERDLIEVFHRPGNRAVHDRMSERIVARLAPDVAAIIADGIERGVFRRQDPGRAAAFVLGCFASLHDVVGEVADVPAATDELNAFVLRGLGYDGAIPG